MTALFHSADTSWFSTQPPATMHPQFLGTIPQQLSSRSSLEGRNHRVRGIASRHLENEVHVVSDDRAERWISLLTRLTTEFPRWAVWKNAASALNGHGDIDSFAPPEDWPGIEDEWLNWLQTGAFTHAIVCRHVPQGPHFVALENGSPWIWQLDVKVAGTFRGATLIDVDKLHRMVEFDEAGYRRVRPGAEGVLKLLYNGMQRFGACDEQGLETKQVVPLLASDPEGVQLAADLLCGPTAGSMMKAVDALLLGEWDQPSLRRVETWFRVKALAEPRRAVSRVWFNTVSKKVCPILQIIRNNDRRIPDDSEAWLAAVAKNHVVHELCRP